jgi:hypothetical protein
LSKREAEEEGGEGEGEEESVGKEVGVQVMTAEKASQSVEIREISRSLALVAPVLAACVEM